jgi:hypothetical protein
MHGEMYTTAQASADNAGTPARTAYVRYSNRHHPPPAVHAVGISTQASGDRLAAAAHVAECGGVARERPPLGSSEPHPSVQPRSGWPPAINHAHRKRHPPGCPIDPNRLEAPLLPSVSSALNTVITAPPPPSIHPSPTVAQHSRREVRLRSAAAAAGAAAAAATTTAAAGVAPEVDGLEARQDLAKGGAVARVPHPALAHLMAHHRRVTESRWAQVASEWQRR